MQEEHISDRTLFQAAGWEPIDSIIQRACWTWLGHVAIGCISLLYLSWLFGVALFFQGWVKALDARVLVEGGFGQDVLVCSGLV